MVFENSMLTCFYVAVPWRGYRKVHKEFSKRDSKIKIEYFLLSRASNNL